VFGDARTVRIVDLVGLLRGHREACLGQVRQVLGGTGACELERVDDRLYCAVDVVAVCPWRAKLYEIPTISYSSWLSSPSPAEEAKVMLQGVGARFDFHMCKTLCDLRFVDELGIYGTGNLLRLFSPKGWRDL